MSLCEKESKKDISVIVPLYNGSKYINKIINMVINNVITLSRNIKIELLFINDYSKALDTNVVNKACPANLTIRFIENEINIGIHGSRVKGAMISEGRYLIFLDQDDIIYDTYILSQFNLINDGDIVICNGINNHKLIYSDKHSQEQVIKLNEWPLGKNPIVSPGQAFIKKSAIPDLWFDNIMKYNGADDLFLWLSLYINKARFKINESILYEHIWHADNTSSNREKMKQSLDELKSIAKKVNMGKNEIEVINQISNRHMSLLDNASMCISVLKQWLYFSEKGVRIEDILLKKGYKNIAIYGLGTLGNCLYHSLSSSLIIKIVYGIDKRAESFKYNFPVFLPEEDIPSADVIIVTLPGDFSNIRDKLDSKATSSIISIEDVFS